MCAPRALCGFTRPSRKAVSAAKGKPVSQRRAQRCFLTRATALRSLPLGVRRDGGETEARKLHGLLAGRMPSASQCGPQDGAGELDATLLSWPHSLPNLCMYASSSDSVPCPESHFASSLVCALMSALAMAVSTLVRGRDRVQAEFLPSKCVHSHWDSILHLSEKAL